MCVNKASRKGVWVPVLQEHVGGRPSLCVCWLEANIHISSCWESDERVACVTPLLGWWNGPLEENIADKIYRPEQCSKEVQRPAERLRFFPKASKCQPLLPWGTLIETGSSVWWPKTERNYKNDQNEAVHESPNKTKLPVSRISDCPLASMKQDAPQALKLRSLINPVSTRLWVWIAGKGTQRKAYT